MRSNATAPSSEPADSTVFRALVLSVIAGFADAVTFLKYGMFAGVMTGNTVLLGVALADDEVVHALRLALIIGCYLAGIALATVLRRLGHCMRVCCWSKVSWWPSPPLLTPAGPVSPCWR